MTTCTANLNNEDHVHTCTRPDGHRLSGSHICPTCSARWISNAEWARIQQGLPVNMGHDGQGRLF
ncbi:hypothetical protein ACWZJV_14490 [Nocardioides sp. WG-D5]